MRRLISSLSLNVLLRAMALGMVVFAVCVYSLALARSTGSAGSVWIANGIVVGCLLRLPVRQWWGYVLCCFAGNLGAECLLDAPTAVSLGVAAADMLEVLLVAGIVRRRFADISANTPYSELGRTATGSTLLACAVSAAIAGVTMHLALGLPVWATIGDWYRAHVLGMVIVATLTATALLQKRRLLGAPGKRLPYACDMALLAAITLAVFVQSRYTLLFLVYPPLLLVVFRHRFAGLVLGVALVAAITNLATALHIGPFNLIAGGSLADRTFLAQVFLGAVCLVTVPVSLVLAERRQLALKMRESELRYRLLADYAGDLVMRIRPDGERRYVSPSIRELLGWEVQEFMLPRPDLIHPDDRERVADAVANLHREGGSATTTYRIRHKQGHYVWFEALARVVPSPEQEGVMEIIYTGRDITQRVRMEQALADSERRLRTVADNVPAVIAHVDAKEHYTFVNAYVQQVSGDDPSLMIGKSMLEVRGEQTYTALREHVASALAGIPVVFEYEADYQQRHAHFQSHFVPDRDAEGNVQGFYALTTDITHIKGVEQELSRLARFDTLTGLANRHHFNERIAAALAQKHRRHAPMLLMMIDVDHFKHVNDSWGHGIGDEVLKEIGQRIHGCVRKDDLVARIGGDEFVVLIEDVDSPLVGEALTRKVCAAMNKPVTLGIVRLQMTLSIGVAFYRDAVSVDEFMQLADDALYEAKEAGRNTYRLAQGL